MDQLISESHTLNFSDMAGGPHSLDVTYYAKAGIKYVELAGEYVDSYMFLPLELLRNIVAEADRAGQ